MKKSNIAAAIVASILLVIYNLLVFVLPFGKNDIFWLSYGFTMDAFVIAGAACVIAFRSGKSVTSKFSGYPIARVGIIYLVVQVILCFIFMTLSQWLPIWLGVLVYALVLGTAVIGLIATDAVRDHIQYEDAKLKANVSTIRSAQSAVNLLVLQCQSEEAANALRSLSEDLRYSDPVSSPELEQIEAALAGSIDVLRQTVNSQRSDYILSQCKHISALLAERNRLCKLSKQHHV